MTTDEFLPRRAINPNGHLGSFYDVRCDQLSDETIIPRLQQTDSTSRKIRCSIETCSNDQLSNLLKLIRIDDELRLSIASQMIPAEGIAGLFNATGSTNRYTRIFSYTLIDRTESFSSDDLTKGITNDNDNDTDQFDFSQNDEIVSIPAAYFIASIHVGIEVQILLQLPPNDQDARRIDVILQRAAMSLQNFQTIHLVGDDGRYLQKISQTQIFSNVSSITQLKTIADFFREIDRLKSDKRIYRPCEYKLCPATRIYSIDDIVEHRYRPINARSSEKIENYILDLFLQVKNLRKEINENIDEMDQLYQNELERIRTWISNARQSSNDKNNVDQMLKAEESQTFRRALMRIDGNAQQLKTFKQYFKNKSVPKEFQYRQANDYAIENTDDDNVLQKKFVGEEKNLRVFCANYSLYNDDLNNWNNVCEQLLDEQRENSQLKVIFVDFTDHSYPLDQLKIFSSIDSKTKMSPEIPQTPTASKRIQFDKTFNILLFGESGVGKTTFINALMNYLHFDSFDEASEAEPVVLLPTSFIITTGSNYEEHEIEYEGLDRSENEFNNHVGQSVTQNCRSYSFTVKDKDNIERQIRLIDTPGMNDSRGVAQDDKNLQQILSYLSTFQHLHAICIILRPNVARLNVTFRSSLMQIFDALGDKIRDNILFCFTNARTTFYSPGNTGPLLKVFLESLPIERIPFVRSNTFCFDSESFRYLAAKNRGIQFDEYETNESRETWQRSAPEAKRFLQFITTQMNSYDLHHQNRTKKKAQFDIHLLVEPMINQMKNHLQQKSTTMFDQFLEKSVHFGRFITAGGYSLDKDQFIITLRQMIADESHSATKELLHQLIQHYEEQMAKSMSQSESADLSEINKFINELHGNAAIHRHMREIENKQRAIFQDQEFQVIIPGLHFN